MTGEKVIAKLNEIVESPPEEYAYALLVTYVQRCHGDFPAEAFRYLWFHDNAAVAKARLGDDVCSEIDAAVLSETGVMST